VSSTPGATYPQGQSQGETSLCDVKLEFGSPYEPSYSPEIKQEASSSQSLKVGSGGREGSQSRMREVSPQLNSATMSLAHEGGQHLGFKRSSAIRPGEESLDRFANRLKGMSDELAEMSSKILKIGDVEVSQHMHPSKRARLD